MVSQPINSILFWSSPNSLHLFRMFWSLPKTLSALHETSAPHVIWKVKWEDNYVNWFPVQWLGIFEKCIHVGAERTYVRKIHSPPVFFLLVCIKHAECAHKRGDAVWPALPRLLYSTEKSSRAVHPHAIHRWKATTLRISTSIVSK